MITTSAKISAAFSPKTAQFPINEGVRLSHRYALENKVHASAHSVLFHAKDRKSKHLRAIKHRFALSSAAKRKAKNQAQMLGSLRHPGILRMSHFYERHDQTLSVAEFCSGGSLLSALSYIGPFNESLACMVVQQLLDILVYLEREGVAHRNISLKNVLFKRPKLLKHSIRLIDFSYAKRIPGATSSPIRPFLIGSKQSSSSASEWCSSSPSPSPFSSPCHSPSTRDSLSSSSGSIRILNLIRTPPLLPSTQEETQRSSQQNNHQIDTPTSFAFDRDLLPQERLEDASPCTEQENQSSLSSPPPRKSSSALCSNKLQARVGDIHYMAPEVLGSEGYGLPRDIWSVGVLLFMLLTGKAPFDGATQIAICKAILSKNVNEIIESECSHLSEDARDVLRALLSRSPDFRPTAKEALGFGWFRANTWTDDSSFPEEDI